MKVLRNIKVPTGNILTVQGDKGELELLSIGDYGKQHNLKSNFMDGLDREIIECPHTKMLPLEEKWVVTISTQYGCSMGCNFCDVPKVGPGKNTTFNDIVNQVRAAIQLHPEVTYSNRLNLHYARMGEPTWNPEVLEATEFIEIIYRGKFKLHPVISTMMPKHNPWLRAFLQEWMHIKNTTFQGDAGLQISINSTNEEERQVMFNDNALSLRVIRTRMLGLRPIGRKITLNFAVADWEIDPQVLLHYFDPKDYLIKLTPMHVTNTASENNLATPGDSLTTAPYKHHEEALRAAGYDVLVFIASEEEDKGRITCGNAILSGTMPECKHEELTCL